MNKRVVIITGIGVVIGLISGYLYYQQIGCASGTCAITSKPLNSTLYGGLMGGLLFNLFVTAKKEIWPQYNLKENEGLGYDPLTGKIIRN
jgi:hypothetical protein